MRRREWGAIVAGFALVAFTACGGGEKTENNTPPAETAPPAATTPPAATPPATTAAAPGTPPAGATPEMVAEGQKVFSTTVCFTCHGQDAKGTQLAPNLTDGEWLNINGTYDEIQKIVTNGVPTPKKYPAPMPPKGGAQLTDAQVKAVAAYVWSLGGGK
jgi:mono/diheme cytochrome c family protein